MKNGVIALLLILLAIAVMLDDGRQQSAQAAVLIHADYQRCVTIQNGPIVRQRGVPLYPNRSELS